MRNLPPRLVLNDKDRRRWWLHIGKGMSVEEIASMEKVAPTTIQGSIDCMEQYKFSMQNEMLHLKVVETALKQMDSVHVVLQESMKAKKVVHVNAETGKVTEVADTAMRLKAVETVRGFIETVQPKGPGIQLNQQFNNAGAGAGVSSGMSFEAVLRKKREERGMVNGQGINDTEAVESAEDSVSREFADFGGDEEDEDGDESDEDEDDDGE